MADYEKLKKTIEEKTAEYHKELVALNDDLADHPEISGQEFESSKKIVNLLRGKGYEVEYPFAGLETAFKAVYGDNSHKHKVAIMTEYDALPEIGHACGHCLSGSISILAGLAVKDLQDELDTDVHIIGTPVEETDGAKCAMVDAGVFDEYDMAIMIHLYNKNLIDPTFLALSSYMYEFYGKAAHASDSPWDGRNAFNGAQLMFHGIDMLRQHSRPDVRMHGIIRNGGEAPNIVPEFVSAEVYIRALDRDYLEGLVSRVDDCARGAAIATQTEWKKYNTAATYDNLKSNPTGVSALTEVYNELGIHIDEKPDVPFGSSDAGNVSYACPTFHPTLKVVNDDVVVHTRAFADAMKTDRAHDALLDGGRIIALDIAKIFSDEEKIKKLREDFERN